MLFMKRLKIVVLRGGPSSEHEVSLKTGKSVIDTLKDDHDILDVVIDKEGRWFVNGIEKTPAEAIRLHDVVFNAMHGEYGEDGTVQELLELLNVPFTGPKKLGAKLSINKKVAKDIYKQAGLKTPHARVVTNDLPTEQIAKDLFNTFPLPAVIKPIDKGSSVGISIARDYPSLLNTLRSLFEYSEKLLVEEYIQGKEATVGVIDQFRDKEHYSLLPIEIIPPDSRDFFDYECKYDGTTQEICPGRFTAEENKLLQEAAIEAHKALGLRHYSRSDFIIHPRRGIYILETNSLPGLTSESLMPKAMEPVGSSYRELLEHIITLALEGK